MNKNLLLALVAVITSLIGGGIGWWIGNQSAAEPRATVISLSNELMTVKEENKKISGELNEAKRNFEQAKKDIENAKSVSAPAPATAATPAPNSFLNTISEQASAMHKTMANAKFLALKERLKLTDSQAIEVQKILTMEAEQGSKMMSQMMSGKPLTTEQTQGTILTIDSVLTPEQKTAYKSYLDEQAAQGRETMANMELGMISQMFKITEEQKDQIFAKLSEENTSLATAKAGTTPSSSLDQIFENKKTILKPILTPEQFDIYSKQLDVQKEMAKKMLPKTD